jgi:hypothetical protein
MLAYVELIWFFGASSAPDSDNPDLFSLLLPSSTSYKRKMSTLKSTIAASSMAKIEEMSWDRGEVDLTSARGGHLRSRGTLVYGAEATSMA